MKNLKKSAFSLIELSIVVLIIGIIIVGVTQSSRVIRQMKLASARSLTEGSPVSSINGLVLWLETTSEKAFSRELEDATYLPNGTKWLDRNPQSSLKADAVTSILQNAPIYVDSCINDLPCLSFNTVDQRAMDVTQEMGNSEGLSIFIIFKTPAELSDNPGLILNTGGELGGGWFRIGTNGSATWYMFNDSTGGFNNVLITERGFIEKSTPYIIGLVSNSIGISSYSGFNGSMSTSQTAVLPERPNLNNGLNIGYYDNDNYLEGFISEIIIFDRALKNEEEFRCKII